MSIRYNIDKSINILHSSLRWKSMGFPGTNEENHSEGFPDISG